MLNRMQKLIEKINGLDVFRFGRIKRLNNSGVTQSVFHLIRLNNKLVFALN